MSSPFIMQDDLPLVRLDSTLRTVTEALQISPGGLVLVLDDDEKLCGVITDRRLRQAIIEGHRIDSIAEQFMEVNAPSLPAGSSETAIKLFMDQHKLRDLPLLDAEGRISRLVRYEQFNSPLLENAAVIMAGGKGKRLMPLTQNIPKPMLKIGDKPMIAGIIDALYRNGIRNIYVSLGYKAEIIQSYLDKIDIPDLTVKTVLEDKPLGTGGALTLIEEKFEHPFLVLNADVITNLDLRELVRFHEYHQAEMTVGVTSYQLQIPFGVLEMDEIEVLGVSEKPRLEFPIVAGIYVISPDVLKLMKYNTFQDLPDLIPTLIEKKHKVVGFPIWEKWMDIGSPEQFKIAQRELGDN
ncbi:nucleotidyltransferase family protein [Calditrichota bacterium]